MKLFILAGMAAALSGCMIPLGPAPTPSGIGEFKFDAGEGIQEYSAIVPRLYKACETVMEAHKVNVVGRTYNESTGASLEGESRANGTKYIFRIDVITPGAVSRLRTRVGSGTDANLVATLHSEIHHELNIIYR